MAFFFWFITKVTQENHKKLVNTIIVEAQSETLGDCVKILIFAS